MNGAHYGRGIDHGLIAYHLGNAKICNSGIQIFINQNILGFNIAVNNVLAMSVLQCICQAYANFQNCAYGKLIALQIILQGNAFHIFHNDVFFITLGNYVIYIDDVRVL